MQLNLIREFGTDKGRTLYIFTEFVIHLDVGCQISDQRGRLLWEPLASGDRVPR